MSLMLEPAREGGLKLQKHIGEVLIGVGKNGQAVVSLPYQRLP